MLPVTGKREKRGGDCQKRGELQPAPPTDLLAQGDEGACGSPKILVQGILIARKLGIRIVYLKFEGFGFGWGSLFGWP